MPLAAFPMFAVKNINLRNFPGWTSLPEGLPKRVLDIFFFKMDGPDHFEDLFVDSLREWTVSF